MQTILLLSEKSNQLRKPDGVACAMNKTVGWLNRKYHQPRCSLSNIAYNL